MTGALRIDAGSGFGGAYAVAAYPKASVRARTSIARRRASRRAAFGESGVQPSNGAAIELFTPTQAPGIGGAISGFGVTTPGNPNLEPERSEEYEGGLDVGLWGNRATLELTGYSKTTHDALFDQTLGFDLGGLPYQVNLGEVRNSGIEATVTAAVLQSRDVAWNLSLNASVNHNKLLSMAPGVAVQTLTGLQQQVVGYPLYGYWGCTGPTSIRITTAFSSRKEYAPSDTSVFAGSSLPTREVSLTSHLGLFRSAVTIGALLDYRGGFKVWNGVAYTADAVLTERENVDPTAPLWMQARVLAGDGNSLANFVEMGLLSASASSR